MRAVSGRKGLAFLVVLPALAAIAVIAALASQAGPLRPFLPAGSDVPGWAQDGGPQEFEGEDLYTYIDGGAEIYQEYGFRRVIVQDYENTDGKSISLEIFEMETPAAAYGMFTFKRSGQGRRVDRGGGGELEAYYMNFWKGRYLATLTGFDDSPGTVDGLLALARVVDAKIEDGGRAPALVDRLPPENLVPESVKYFRGLLGLNNLYSLFTARGLAFAGGVRGLYGDGAALILLDYGTGEGRGKAWAELGPFLEGSDRFKPQATDRPKVSLFMDGKGRFVAFSGTGPRLAIGVAATAASALDIVSRAR